MANGNITFGIKIEANSQGAVREIKSVERAVESASGAEQRGAASARNLATAQQQVATSATGAASGLQRMATNAAAANTAQVSAAASMNSATTAAGGQASGLASLAGSFALTAGRTKATTMAVGAFAGGIGLAIGAVVSLVSSLGNAIAEMAGFGEAAEKAGQKAEAALANVRALLEAEKYAGYSKFGGAQRELWDEREEYIKNAGTWDRITGKFSERLKEFDDESLRLGRLRDLDYANKQFEARQKADKREADEAAKAGRAANATSRGRSSASVPKTDPIETGYKQALQQFAQAERNVWAETDHLTQSQRQLQDVMASPNWAKMTPAMQEQIRIQAEAASGAERQKATLDAYNASANQFGDIIRRAQTGTAGLTDAQRQLADVMNSEQWDKMSASMQHNLKEGARLARQAEGAAALSAALRDISAAEDDATGATDKLDAAQRRLLELMNSPEWAQMSAGMRQMAIDRADEASRTLKATEQAAARSKLTDSIAGDVAKGISQGLMTGQWSAQSFSEMLGNSLMNATSSGLQKGIQKALDVAVDWIASALQSAASSVGNSAGGNSGWASALASLFGSMFASAKGNAFTGSGVAAFAKGGAFGAGEVLTRPTLFRFASGGTWRNGVAGEAGPEAALPLKRMSDGRLGVFAQSGNAAPVNVSIVINTDSGERQESGNSGDYTDFARRLEGAVRQVIATEMRPQGMLARS